eukprot:TRINITY_DN20975_c0_g1_i1.p1 TRINITY_DN20975_c0_g1~~TRINITY_DN20975_c0_g1_i1.p1  ORF type:complete len:198 (+),score=21.07 TRINITY_DN20975_c0_g1_i1:71-595(+)
MAAAAGSRPTWGPNANPGWRPTPGSWPGRGKNFSLLLTNLTAARPDGGEVTQVAATLPQLSHEAAPMTCNLELSDPTCLQAEADNAALPLSSPERGTPRTPRKEQPLLPPASRTTQSAAPASCTSPRKTTGVPLFPKHDAGETTVTTHPPDPCVPVSAQTDGMDKIGRVSPCVG